MEKLVLVLDCGATNVRAVAIDTTGKIHAIHSVPNNTRPDPFFKGGLIWDIDEIWGKLIKCIQLVIKQIDSNNLSAVTITTFGVNGAPVDKSGNLLYPVISWQCQRTVSVMNEIEKFIPLERLYQISGVQNFSFNTIYNFIWYKQNMPEILDKMETFLFIPSLFVKKLTGEKKNDSSMAGTSMLTDIYSRNFSDEILNAIGVDNKFQKPAEPGTIAGKVTKAAAGETGILEGTPVVLAGHDTQFALFGSGAKENEPVLSSGTWEILMVRSKEVSTGKSMLDQKVTNELDALPGLFNIGVQWLASGVMEWVKNMFFHSELNLSSDALYKLMIDEASQITEVNGRIDFNPDFLNNKGAISGIGMHTRRGNIYRAALESMAFNTKNGLNLIEKAGGFKASSLLVVGGGAKNNLWNQIRANCLQIPVKIIDISETTVLGAALFAFAGVGLFSSADEARKMVLYNPKSIFPE